MSLKPSPFAPDRFPDLPNIKGMRAATGSRGFYAGRGLERDDVFLLAFEEGTIGAGVFTRSLTASADVDWCREALAKGGGKASAVVANAGNSNAFTGPKGREKNEATLAALTASLNVDKSACFIAATGVIGEPLPDPNYVGSIVPALADTLSEPDWEACARAFMTTDTYPKGAGKTVQIDGKTINLAGICKGSGMIAPNMGTMLAYVCTDMAIAAHVLDAALRRVADATFNCATVDSDTSTSDTLMVFATGGSGAAPVEAHDDPRLSAFEAALYDVCLDLAHQLVKDGEGASKFVEIEVKNAVSKTSAKAIAVSIANSPLVKTALAANDANWGRVVMAAGKAGEPLNKERLSIWFDDLQVAENGSRADGYSEERASAMCTAPEITITVDVGVGDAAATVWTCDLTHGYVEINGAYRT